MKIRFLILPLLLAAFSCSDSTGPDNNGSDKLLATATIGPTGGELKTDVVTVTVPEGAFASSATVALASTTEDRYGENAVSSTYKLTGIPDNFSSPLAITLAYKGALSNETFIVIEEPVTDPLSGENVRFQHFYRTLTSDSTVSCTLPPQTLAAAKKLAQKGGSSFTDLYITAVTNYLIEKNAPHFPFTTPEDFADYSKLLGAYLEGVYKVAGDLGFDYHITGNVFGTLDSIFVTYDEYGKDLPPFSDPPVYQFFFPGDVPRMFVDADYAYGSLTSLVKHDAAQTFMLLISRYYTKSDWKPFIWFDLALSDWIARYFNAITDEVPLPMGDKPISTLQGIPVFDISKDDPFLTQARSFSPLIEYFNKKYKITSSGNAISRIYDERYEGKNLAESLESVLGEDEKVWWPEFVKEYIGGTIYDIPASAFTVSTARKGLFTITTTDTLKEFSGVFSDLAADIYSITIAPSFADEVGSIRFTAESNDVADDYLNVLVFGLKGGKLEYVGRGTEFSVTSLQNATDSNTLLAVVANSLFDYPYHTDNDYSLTVTAARKTGFDLADLKPARIVLANFYQEYQVVHPDLTTDWGGGGGGPRMWNDIQMTLEGNVFTGQTVINWTGMFGNSTETIDFTVTVATDLQSADLAVTRVSEDFDAHTLTTENFTIWDLPIQSPAEYSCRAVWGTTTADYMANKHMENITYTYHWESTDGSTGDIRENFMFYCTGAIITFF